MPNYLHSPGDVQVMTVWYLVRQTHKNVVHHRQVVKGGEGDCKCPLHLWLLLLPLHACKVPVSRDVSHIARELLKDKVASCSLSWHHSWVGRHQVKLLYSFIRAGPCLKFLLAYLCRLEGEKIILLTDIAIRVMPPFVMKLCQQKRASVGLAKVIWKGWTYGGRKPCIVGIHCLH